MAAMYWITFDCGSMLQVYSADAKSMKRADIRASYRKAADKAKAKLAKQRKGSMSKVISVRYVG